MSGIIGISPNMKSGVVGIPRLGAIGDSASIYLTTALNNQTTGTYLTGFTAAYNRNTTIFETQANGIKVLVSGTYLINWTIFSYSTNADGYSQEYLTTGGDTKITETYVLYVRSEDGDVQRYSKFGNAHILPIAANTVVGMFVYVGYTGTDAYTVAADTAGTRLAMTYQSEHPATGGY